MDAETNHTGSREARPFRAATVFAELAVWWMLWLTGVCFFWDGSTRWLIACNQYVLTAVLLVLCGVGFRRLADSTLWVKTAAGITVVVMARFLRSDGVAQRP